ncbi:MAG: hypothetical protein K6U14_00365 [Firmicutes bacterium]|nr:hypothetical protein [Alicyclobacillaceae bacterium]MCL6496074.1 hypothetical protein [Bacillota bacterium]
MAAIEYCYDQGWTDGWPVVPPDPERVAAFLATTRRPPDQVIWRMEHVGRECTVELAAINAVMAGCRPEYFPVVLAALEAVIDEGSPKIGAWQSTTGGAPILVVNGPVRQRLGFNSRGNVFGPGFRANATVGRAIRLIILNAYGIRPHGLDQSTQGTPAKYTCCIAENEEDSPWEPLHTELGYDRTADVVSALHVRSIDFVDNRQTADPEALLNDLVDTASRSGALRRLEQCTLFILGPEHAQLLARHGWSKAEVKRYVAERAGKTWAELRAVGKDATEPPLGFARPSTEAERAGRDETAWMRPFRDPSQVLVVVAGAPNAGVSAVAQPFSTRWRKVPGHARVEGN